MTEKHHKPTSEINNLDQVADLYAASQGEQSPTHLDDAIRAAAHRAINIKPASKGKKILRRFDPPIAIAAMLLLSIGLVTLVKEDLDHPRFPASFEPAMTEEAVPLPDRGMMADAEMEKNNGVMRGSATTSATLAEPVDVTDIVGKPEQDRSAGISVGTLSGTGIAADKSKLQKEHIIVRKRTEQQKKKQRYERHLAAQLEEKSDLKDSVTPPKPETRAKIARKPSLDQSLADDAIKEQAISVDAFFADELPATAPAMSPSKIAAPVKRITPNKGDIRTVSGELKVWYNENHRWVSVESFFNLELKRLHGPTYGLIDSKTNNYPADESVKEWETLIDILPDGRNCPMVFFHGRWQRLADVLALDERLRNYSGCADISNNDP